MTKRNVACALLSVLVLTLCAIPSRAADENKPTTKPSDLTGTWKWTVQGRNGDREVTCKLTLDGEKVTGSMTGFNNTDVPITDGTFKDGEVTFKTERTRNDNKITTTYKGKLDGDTIKGNMSINFGDNDRTVDWEAKRVKETM